MAICCSVGIFLTGGTPIAGAGPLPRRPSLGAALIDTPVGPSISAVQVGSAAARAGLRAGDLVKAINDAPVRSAAEAVADVRRSGAGHLLKIAIARANVELRFNIPLPEAARERGSGFITLYGAAGSSGALHRTLLTLPSKMRGTPPVLLIVGGIGCFSVDPAGDTGDAYANLAHDLARRGIASLRVEKTGIGDSEGPSCATSDFHLESQGYSEALDALRHDPRVDRSRIYLFGHSIGSLISPAIAARSPVRGIIVAEGVGRNWFEYELTNLRRQLELQGDSPAKVDDAIAGKERCMHWLLVDGDDEHSIETREPDCRIHNAYPVSAEYMREVAAVNIAQLWQQLPPTRLLAIYGDADVVTDPADHKRIVDIVRAQHGEATFTTIKGMDHHLRHAGSLGAARQAIEDGRESSLPYETRLSETVADWIASGSARPSG